MSTSNNFSVICNEFHPSKISPLFCEVCQCHQSLHNIENYVPPEKVHYPPTNPPPPPPYPAQAPILHYEKVVLDESNKTLTSDQKTHLNLFGDRLGWTLSGHDEREIDEFCAAIEINRIILKKWFKSHKPKNDSSM